MRLFQTFQVMTFTTAAGVKTSVAEQRATCSLCILFALNPIPACVKLDRAENGTFDRGICSAHVCTECSLRAEAQNLLGRVAWEPRGNRVSLNWSTKYPFSKRSLKGHRVGARAAVIEPNCNKKPVQDATRAQPVPSCLCNLIRATTFAAMPVDGDLIKAGV